jgi:phytoene dehydrogenase-like protein
MRRRPQLATDRRAIDGLWMGGPGTHPGGGIPGAAGYHCARQILKSKIRERT